jgi:hypothetical protein
MAELTELKLNNQEMRLLRLASIALYNSMYNEGHPEIEGNMGEAIKHIDHVLGVCGNDNEETACTNPAVFRYTIRAKPGLTSEAKYRVQYCDKCWVDEELGSEIEKECFGCGEELTSTGAVVRPEVCAKIIGKLGAQTVEPLPRLKEPLFHDHCGSLCNVCCQWMVGKEAREAGGGMTVMLPDADVCVHCLDGLTVTEFAAANPEIVEKRDGEWYIKPAKQVGYRHAKKPAQPSAAKAAAPAAAPATPKKRESDSKQPAKKHSK